MSLDEFFMNLKQEEIEHAANWYKNLRIPEQERVAETIRAVNNTQFDLSNNLEEDIRPMAVIVAGSSIDTKNYKDIDLFLLSKKILYPEKITNRRHPKSIFGEQIVKELPKYAYSIIYKETDLRYEPNPELLIKKGLGARVTVSLFYELQGFNQRRVEKIDDLLEPEEPLGAEEIIMYNREQQSKFLVLTRQYAVLS